MKPLGATGGGTLPTPDFESRLRQDQPFMKRTFALLVLLLHLLVAGGAPLAESRIERVSFEPWPHVEAQQDVPCGPSHDDLDCQICRVLGRNLVGPARLAAMLDWNGTAFLSAPPTPCWHHPSGIARTFGARAPPLA